MPDIVVVDPITKNVVIQLPSTPTIVEIVTQGPRGPKGDTGAGLNILGTLTDPSELPETGDLGDGYIIDGDLYVWTGTEWENVGQIQGPQGPQGIQGETGPQGPQGIQGETGPQGLQGETGPQGPQGIQGETGPQGPQGETGPQGPQGIQGETGPQGPQGETGPQGPQGETGPQGPQGETGPQGPQGETGPQGPQGIQGETGPQGPQGIQGEKGDTGAGLNILGTLTDPSELPETGDLGDGYIIDGDLYVWTGTEWENVGQIQGPQGETGPQGPQGETGPQGPQGVQGETGPQGPQGETGPQGPQGETGPQGPQGIQGETGPQGPQGETGPQGPQGETGPQGPQGIQGETGPQGVQGETGPQGPAGPGLPAGGTEYQLVEKASSTDYDTRWTNRPTVAGVNFDTTAALTPSTGQMVWDAETGTVDIGLNGATAPVMSVGEDQFYRVINQTGSTIAKGTLVMAAGTIGASGVIKVAPWDGSQPSKTIMGLAMAAIPTENDPTESGLGYILAFGKLRGIQTNGGNYSESWVDGDIIYAGDSGGLTKTMPAAPKVKTTVAIVINAHASNGTLFVRPTYGSNLGEDELVQLSGLAGGDVLSYDATDGRFENKTLADAGIYASSNPAGYTTNTGTVTSVGGTGTVNGITLTGTVTSSGNLTLGGTLSGVSLTTQVTGTLPVANGGTGLSALGTAGQVIKVNDAGTALEFGSAGASLLGATDSATPFKTLLGYQAGNVTIGTYNTFIGYQTGVSNTTGGANVAVGALALDANLTGGDNVAIGVSALGLNTASSNTAVGYFALGNNTSGTNNTAVGRRALGDNTTANEGAAFGFESLRFSTGQANSAFGYRSGYAVSSGANNTLIGYSAGYSSGGPNLTTGGNNIIVGNEALPSAANVSNEITLGNASITAFRIPGLSISWTSSNVPDVNTTATQTLSGKTLNGAVLNDGYTEEVYAIPSSTTPALSPTNGSIQTWTLTGNSTPTAGTWAAGQSLTLMIDDGTNYTITWTSLAVTWKTDGGSAPTLNTSGFTVIQLWKVGSTIYGARVGDA